MGFPLELNALLVIPDGTIDLTSVRIGERHSVVKDGDRLYPVEVPVDFCDARYQYVGKAIIRKLTLEAHTTTLEFEILNVYSPEEAAVYTRTFIPVKP